MNHPGPMVTSETERAAARRRFHRTLVRVMAVQILTLLLLWLLQARFAA